MRHRHAHYKGGQKQVAQIGRELALDYVVEGSVRRTDDRIAVKVQLIQVCDQTHLYARGSRDHRAGGEHVLAAVGERGSQEASGNRGGAEGL
jgi:hypothetical protein